MTRLPRSRRLPIALGAVIALTAILLPTIARLGRIVGVRPERPEHAPMQVTADCLDRCTPSPSSTSRPTRPRPSRITASRGTSRARTSSSTSTCTPQQDKAAWDGRFFQFTYPAAFTAEQNTARADDRAIGFALASGGYAVQAGNSFRLARIPARGRRREVRRAVAADYYGSDRQIFGYLYGPSGGSLQAVGAAENTDGVWQGFVPMVQAVPQPNSYNFIGRSAAELILADKATEIRDALMPGGSGDPYATLDEAERACSPNARARHPLEGVGVPRLPARLRTAVLRRRARLRRPARVRPHLRRRLLERRRLSRHRGVPTRRACPRRAGRDGRHHRRTAGTSRSASTTATSCPQPTEGGSALDQFRNADGTPLYPQRAGDRTRLLRRRLRQRRVRRLGQRQGHRGVNLYDTDALPCTPTGTASASRRASAPRRPTRTGSTSTTTRTTRMRRSPESAAKLLVNWYGIVEQALRDVAAWAEDGVAAPGSTSYSIEDAQIVVPELAPQRGGTPADGGHSCPGRRRVDQGEGRQARGARRGRAHSGKAVARSSRPSGTSRATASTSPERSTSRSRSSTRRRPTPSPSREPTS